MRWRAFVCSSARRQRSGASTLSGHLAEPIELGPYEEGEVDDPWVLEMRGGSITVFHGIDTERGPRISFCSWALDKLIMNNRTVLISNRYFPLSTSIFLLGFYFSNFLHASLFLTLSPHVKRSCYFTARVTFITGPFSRNFASYRVSLLFSGKRIGTGSSNEQWQRC